MSELFMECEEEELEPWQIQVPQINLVDDDNDDDDDDELIFVGELSSPNATTNNGRPTNNQSIVKTIPVQTAAAVRPEVNRMPLTLTSNIQSLHPQPALGVGQPISQSITVASQPIIINNQGFFVSTPQQLSNSSSTFITSLGKQYPPGTSFTIVPASQQQFLQQLAPSNPTPGVVHRPQVQQICKNVVTLSNVQSPAAFSQASAQGPRLLPQTVQTVQIVSGPIKAPSTTKDNNSVKRSLPPDQNESTAKKSKTDVTGSTKGSDQSENGTFKLKCPKCREQFFDQEIIKIHMKACCPHLVECLFPGKRIMLVKDFYYGKHEGDKLKQNGVKTNTTFKCQSCLKVLKNNVRFMNHMKHHLELEKQNSESWESHTTCQHCYRQYTTPFQLQCHIESAHSPYESSTNCKICELAFESEQVLLEHMKDNHKPGEMPYMCQVCSFRSSFFSEVETHFRSVHENTKDLLCPFCLKVLRTGHVYMQHYMKHQRKGIHRCGKCRLNFLTYKERVDHKLHFHKTFKKPTALEGLPPGTKVTIRASFTAPAPTSQHRSVLPAKSFVSIAPDDQGAQKTQTLSGPKSKSAKQKEKAAKKKDPPKKHNKANKALKNLRYTSGKHTCIECETTIDDFVSHYSSYVVTCGACKYKTSCKVSIGNHMIRFHSTVKDRYKKLDRQRIPPVLKGLTLVCLNCDLLADASESDRMTKHLTDRPHHVCKVIEEKSFSGADSSKRFPQSAEPAVDSVPSAAGGAVKEAGQDPKPRDEAGQDPKPRDEVILIDDETTARQPADAAKQGPSSIDLTQEDTATTPTEGPVDQGEEEEESGLGPPSPPVTAEPDVGVASLDESPRELDTVSVDDGEQAPSPPEPCTASTSPGDESMGPEPAEASPLVSESPAESMGPGPAEASPPVSESPAESMGPGPAEASPPVSESPAESMGPGPAEASPPVSESPAEDDLNPPEEEGRGTPSPSDESQSKLGMDVGGEQTLSPPGPHTASEDETTGPAEASPLITDEDETAETGPAEAETGPAEAETGPAEAETGPAEASPPITEENPTEDDHLPPEGSGEPPALEQQEDSAAVE